MTSSNLLKPAPCYGDESSSDVIFFVGTDEERWRLPAHRDFLAQRNQVFSAMFSSNFFYHFDQAGLPIVQIATGEPRCFDNFLRFLYNVPIPLQSLETAMATFQIADQYLCSELCQLCVSDIADKVNPLNVLNVYKFVHFYYQRLVSTEISLLRNEFSNGASSIDITTSPLYSVMNLLYNKCLKIIDQGATTVLSSDQIEDLSLPQLRSLLSRSSLQVPNELYVFNILQRWAEQECKRLRIPFTCENKKLVLGDTLYVCRFFLMSPEDFELGPATSGLLSQDFVTGCRLVQTLLQAKTCNQEPSESHQLLNDVIAESIQAYVPEASKALTYGILSPRAPMLTSAFPAMSLRSNRSSTRVKLALKKIHHLISDHHRGIQATKFLIRLTKNTKSSKRSQFVDKRLLQLKMLKHRLNIHVQRVWVLWAFFFD